MLYDTYEMQRAWLASVGAWANLTATWLSNPHTPLA